MASIIKRKYKVKDEHGNLVLDGKGRPVVKTCRCYSIYYHDGNGKRRLKRGYTDLAATKQLAAQLERAVARGATDLVDPYAVHKATQTLTHISAYIADLRTAGRSKMYVYNQEKRLQKVAKGCEWATLGQIEPNGFIRWRDREGKARRSGRGRDGLPPSARTLNQYLEALRSFLNWCKSTNRLPANPLEGVSKAQGEIRRKRRALTDEQVKALLVAAPPDRRLVYRFAFATGLRRSELARLQWGDLGLHDQKGYVQLRAEATKARRADRLPLPAFIVAAMREAKPKGARDNSFVFPVVPSIELWKEDLAAAKIPWKDGQGRQVDFHAGIRKTLCTQLHRAGVPLATAMRIMRHTDAKLTMVDYTDDSQLGVDQAIAALPDLAATPKDQAKSKEAA